VFFFWVGFRYKVDKIQDMEYHQSYMIVANHILDSRYYVDAPLLKIRLFFVGKKNFLKFRCLVLQVNLYFSR
jgi:1-acyl-sn-glycerol-3-phosphate acyltransferase